MPVWVNWFILLVILIYLVIIWLQFYRRCLKITLSAAIAFTLLTLYFFIPLLDILIYPAKYKKYFLLIVLFWTIYFVFPAVTLIIKYLMNKKKKDGAR